MVFTPEERKASHREASKKWNANNREACQQIQKDYYERNKLAISARRKERREAAKNRNAAIKGVIDVLNILGLRAEVNVEVPRD